MEGKCSECSSWAESMYWSHLECMHFCHIIDADSDFHTQLMIPKKFSENARRKLQETVTVKVPSGTATWQVKLTAIGDALFLKDGWRDFLSAFTVEKNDILIFKYTGNSCFQVLIFDGQSLCEKESSYFIRNCGHSELGIIGNEKKFAKENPEVFTQENPSENSELTPLKKHKGETYKEKSVASEEQVTLGAGAEVTESKAPPVDMSKPKVPSVDFGAARERPRTRSWGWEPVKLPAAEKQNPAKKEPTLDYVTYISKRRPVTEDEKEKPLQMARKELTKGSFLVVMRATHVYKKFFLKFMIYEKQAVHLQVNEKAWMTRLVFSSKRRGGLSFGWREFSLENYLEESDVLVFKLKNQKHEPVLLTVSIFRVVPETVKSIRVPPTSKKN